MTQVTAGTFPETVDQKFICPTIIWHEPPRPDYKKQPDRVRIAGYYTNFVQSVRDSIGFENSRSKSHALNTILPACKEIRVFPNKVTGHGRE